MHFEHITEHISYISISICIYMYTSESVHKTGDPGLV
jgi:hypothetical protein